MSVDHASAVAAPKSDPVFLHVKAGITVIVTDTEGAWRMADVIWVDGGARNPKVSTLFAEFARFRMARFMIHWCAPDPTNEKYTQAIVD